MGVTITDRDLGMKAIERELKRLKRTFVTVGVHGMGERGKDDNGKSVTVKAHEGGKKPIDMPRLAGIHEFGTEKIPERSFVRAGIDQHRAAINAAMDIAGARVAAGEATATQAMSLVGVIAVGAIKATIMDGIKPELAVSTRVNRLRMTKKGRAVVNRGMKALRAAVNGGKSKSGFARWTGGVGKHGRWVASKGKNVGHQKALLKLESELAGPFTPLVNTGQLVGSIAYQVETSKGGR